MSVMKREKQMEQQACSIYSLNLDLKKNREQLQPLRESLITSMRAQGKTSVSAGEGFVLKLLEKKTRKAVGSRLIYSVITEVLGVESAELIKKECELKRG